MDGRTHTQFCTLAKVNSITFADYVTPHDFRSAGINISMHGYLTPETCATYMWAPVYQSPLYYQPPHPHDLFAEVAGDQSPTLMTYLLR